MNVESRVSKVEQRLGMNAEREDDLIIDFKGRIVRLGRKQFEEYFKDWRIPRTSATNE